LGWQIDAQSESDETRGTEKWGYVEPVDSVDDTGGQD